MSKLINICGVHCKPGNALCNGYCTGKVDAPAPLTSNTFEANLAKYKPTDAACERLIAAEHYWQVPVTYMTVCALVLNNGFTVTGESACATPEEFDDKIGRRVARENAKRKIIALECYALRERLSALRLAP